MRRILWGIAALMFVVAPAGAQQIAKNRPVVFTGTTAGTANAQTIVAPTPRGFVLNDQYEVLLKVGSGLTNTGPTTLNIGGTGALTIATQSDGGLSALVGGELQAGLQYNLSYQASCPAPISANCYVIKTVVASGVTNTAISPSMVTPALWRAGHFYSISASGQTITLPASTTLSPIGGLLINAIGSVTVQSTSPDVICSSPGGCGSPGGSAVINAGTHTAITSDGAGHIYVPLGTAGSISGLTTNTIPKATSSAAIGNSSITDDGTNVVIGDAIKNFQANTNTVALSVSTFTPSMTSGVNFAFPLVHASCPCTIANPSAIGSAIGQTGMLDITQSSTGNDTVTWGSEYITPGGTSTLTLSTAANAVDHIPYRVIDGTHVLLGPVLQNAAH